ncbi:MAG: 6-pyruvoyl-tetrahydropterin synthase-related protein [Weeksellaceae bacterium]
MLQKKTELASYLFIFIISVVFVFDLFLQPGIPTTFDGPTHVANIAQVYGALADGEFPARWGNGFARYGLPIPIFAQQVTSYLGAFLTFITGNVVTSYNLVVFLGVFLATVLLYRFLRYYVSPLPALIGAAVFHFAPYRINNVYVRGALPEFFSSIFTIMTLISLQIIFERKQIRGYFLLILSLTLLLLTHPFMAVVTAIFAGIYTLWLIRDNKHKRNHIIALGTAGAAAIGLAGYYLVPLFVEIRYFFYGSGGSYSHFLPGHFLSWQQFVTERWPYFFGGDIFPRPHIHQIGLLELAVIMTAFVVAVVQYKRKKQLALIHVVALTVAVYVFFLTSFSEILYTKILPLGNIQHPWRMFSGFILLPGILAALLLERYKKYTIVGAIIIITAISVMRIPQLYGKNSTKQEYVRHFVTEDNLHGPVMNTVWMGETRSYPFRSQKARIIDGKGTITAREEKNASRKYTIQAETPVRLVDYTFYFPGWMAYVDGKPTTIEFQDPNYRGALTYNLPAGTHEVLLRFEETKIRIVGDLMTLVSIAGMIMLWLSRQRIAKFLMLK